ncbi:hypothetical protein HMPREF9554_02550 [Treponema phagedenis F0421]|nr:hypothetical protein HMPREF9554_02550 [Treponema phagedenis F0421]
MEPSPSVAVLILTTASKLTIVMLNSQAIIVDTPIFITGS